MTDDNAPLDADELMNFAERIEHLPPADAEWVSRLFDECLRARMNEAELMSGQGADAETGSASGTELAQVALDTAEWLKTLWNVGYMGAGSFPSQPRTAFPSVDLEDVIKSALFARIRAGKRPLPFPPPTRDGLPWHDLLEGDGQTHAVAAQIVHGEDGAPIAADIEGCHDWRLVEEVAAGREYLVQHLGKGPLFNLRIDGEIARLRRELPRWQREIRLDERGGFRSYTLAWPRDDGRIEAVSLRAATWERAESEAAHWIASQHPQMYGQVSFVRSEAANPGVTALI